MSDQDALIQNFCDVTGSDPHQARHFLEASNWNIESATEQFYEANEDAPEASHHHLDSDSDGSEALYDPPRQASGGVAASGSKSKFATLEDLKGKDGEEDEASDDEKQDFFAGGEKSGLAVQNPGDPRNKGHIIRDILKRAAEGGQQEEEAGPSRPRFSGTGRTLGSEDTESVEIPDPEAARRPQIPTVTRSLTFWRDGFSVEDGPLMRYDDPANQDVLRAIQNGRAPLSLMNVEPGQPADVNVFRRMDEDYVPTKKKPAPFSGAGQRLGSPTPGESSSSIAPPPANAPPTAPPAAASAPAPSVDVDDSAPHTTLQIRLSDGTRLRSRFNHSHTVADVYGFVNAASMESRTRSYILQTTFPIKELKDMEQTIKDAGLINAVVVQKWA
ncbi:SEP-domain-containing protein [Choiromyces venosus 120613-1]|uniref:SEP-domain-containing protein n=1 Tax=Choiromyces venosus 120613-1 TaxID=1336337 RepID=A0A3N4K4W8_9PEZI|nr:SEP-domain-containing protein [Choiromyces venosus 120613-1]